MYKFLISGGGTGGHIFPAVSIANALKEMYPNCKILFVGALGRMEMERVPAAGYEIVGLPVQGLNRKNPLKNIRVVWNLMRSMRQVRKIIKDFQPDAAVGVGGYASAAALKVAARMGVPCLLQEQNGFAGVTNKMLKNDAKKICVAYEGMERFFPKEKLILTGNPVRQTLMGGSKEEAYKTYGFSAERKTLLVIGGSLGAKTVNDSLQGGLERLLEAGVQVLWQTGKYYYESICTAVEAMEGFDVKKTEDCLQIWKDGQLMIRIQAFVSRMELAYAMADLVISRAGASSISELCLLGKASILVPSPNVAEDHQTHNAMALVKKDAAVLVKDVEAREKLVDEALALMKNPEEIKKLSANVLTLAQKDSAKRIAEEVIKMI